jgi:hypothetical protein
MSEMKDDGSTRENPLMSRTTSAVAAGLLLAALATSPAPAATPVPITHCRLNKSLIPPNSSDANHIRIQISARLIDSYLPRCDLATFVAESASGQRPAASGQRRIVEKGARWYVGTFTCSYRYHGDSKPDETVISTRCVHRGKYPSTVWFDAYA